MSANGFERPATEEPTRAGWMTALISVLILLGGIGAAATLIKTKPEAEKEDEAVVAPLVDVTVVRVGTQRVKMQLNGQVMPAFQSS